MTALVGGLVRSAHVIGYGLSEKNMIKKPPSLIYETIKDWLGGVCPVGGVLSLIAVLTNRDQGCLLSDSITCRSCPLDHFRKHFT